MAQFNFDDPRTQGLLTLAAGLLSQSGWQPQRVGLGEAFGKAGIPALQAMQQARQNQVSMEDLKQLRLMRQMQMDKLGFELGQERELPGQLNQWAGLIADLESGGQQPQVRPMQPQQEFPVPTPLAPYDPNYAMRQNLLGPFAGEQPGVPSRPQFMGAPEDVQLAQTGSTRLQDIQPSGSQARALYDFADKLEMDFAQRFPNPHPKLASTAEKQIASIRARAERIEKEYERRNTMRDPWVGINPADYTQESRRAYMASIAKGAPDRSILVADPRQTREAGASKIGPFGKTSEEERAKQSSEMQKSALKARQYANTVAMLADSLEGYSGGWTAEMQAKLGRLFPASEYGKIGSIDDVGQAIVGKSYSQVRAEGTGATSDFEAKGFIKAFPTLAQTPQGRQFIKTFAKRMADREIAAADIYAELADKGPVKLKEWEARVEAEVGPYFSDDEWKQIRALESGTSAPQRSGTMRRLP